MENENECLGITVEESCKLLGIRKKFNVEISSCTWISSNYF
ncbi:MAG: hypothetical protein Q4D02_07770 [Clostridia bacterium]|nr:hypothetical protein [Clostridia bacterium]